MPSELRVDNINSTTSPYDPVFSTTGGALSHRNMIINGAMQVAQRGASATAIASSGTYSLDRFIGSEDTDGSFTIEQSSTAPAGFTKSLLLTITGADSSIANNQTSHLGQRIEGQNIGHLAWGTSDAKTVTLSFWYAVVLLVLLVEVLLTLLKTEVITFRIQSQQLIHGRRKQLLFLAIHLVLG